MHHLYGYRPYLRHCAHRDTDVPEATCALFVWIQTVLEARNASYVIVWIQTVLEGLYALFEWIQTISK